MIQFLERTLLDEKKYNACIDTSSNGRIYAYTWYLDIVTDGWGALVLNDYEAVMPLPWRKKMGLIKYVYPPFWVQQLGVYAQYSLESSTIKNFVDSIPKSFLKIEFSFNSANLCTSLKLTDRTNYILPLSENYDDLRKRFRKDRKYRINQVKKKGYEIQKISADELIQIAKQFYSYITIPLSAYHNLKNLMNYCVENNYGFIQGVSIDGELIGGCFFLKDAKRITYLFSAMTPKGKKEQVASLLINAVIETYSQSALTLDFEGSMIPGVASFYESFGAKKETYGHFKASVFNDLF